VLLALEQPRAQAPKAASHGDVRIVPEKVQHSLPLLSLPYRAVAAASGERVARSRISRFPCRSTDGRYGPWSYFVADPARRSRAVFRLSFTPCSTPPLTLPIRVPASMPVGGSSRILARLIR
jgi:hypothetical protein